jgi:integrase
MNALNKILAARSSTGTAQSFAFTKREIDSLAVPATTRRCYYRDSKVRGLQLLVYPSGRKTFFLYRKVKGRPERILIGPYPDISIEQARGKASGLNEAIARGENPAEERRQLSTADATLQDAFDSFLELYKKPKRKTWHEDENQLRRYLDWDTSSRWKLRRLSEIRRSDIEQLHIQVGDTNGPYAANRLLALLRSIFNFAIKHGWQGPNPATGIDRFPEEERERFIEPHELPRVWKALHAKATSSDFRDFILFSLYTGARRSNVLSARWEEVSIDDAKWTVPGTKTKNGKPMPVPLSPEVLVIVTRRKKYATSEWVFPSTHPRRKSKSGHFEEPKSQWKELLQRAKIANLRLHDLRRTLGSWQAATGASTLIIGRSLGHLDQATTHIYSRLNLDPVRKSVSTATAAIVAAAKTNRKGQKR